MNEHHLYISSKIAIYPSQSPIGRIYGAADTPFLPRRQDPLEAGSIFRSAPRDWGSAVGERRWRRDRELQPAATRQLHTSKLNLPVFLLEVLLLSALSDYSPIIIQRVYILLCPIAADSRVSERDRRQIAPHSSAHSRVAATVVQRPGQAVLHSPRKSAAPPPPPSTTPRDSRKAFGIFIACIETQHLNVAINHQNYTARVV